MVLSRGCLIEHLSDGIIHRTAQEKHMTRSNQGTRRHGSKGHDLHEEPSDDRAMFGPGDYPSNTTPISLTVTAGSRSVSLNTDEGSVTVDLNCGIHAFGSSSIAMIPCPDNKLPALIGSFVHHPKNNTWTFEKVHDSAQVWNGDKKVHSSNGVYQLEEGMRITMTDSDVVVAVSM